MLVAIARQLDHWLIERSAELRGDGLPAYAHAEIKVVGQAALLEAGVPLQLAATKDVDVRASYEFAVEQEFRRLLEENGRVLDPVGHEAWMPRETRYTALYSGKLVTLLVADADAILVSKALKAPAKNRPLITEYLAKGASTRFFDLAKRYGVDLEQFT
ncbi:MAG: hypothetical protein IPI67_12745 [Myxococcales bacterium]|nr:hypothetical protein [Myxococcales bacterium]